MGIQISNAAVAPSIAYDRVHLVALRITQNLYYDDSQWPKYNVEIEYRLYGIHEGQRYYEIGDSKRVVLEDYLASAQAALVDGDPTLLMALGGIEQAVATILSEQVGLNTSIV